MLLFPSTVVDAAVYITTQGNRSASDEESGAEEEEGQPHNLNRRQILVKAELFYLAQTVNVRE